MTALTFGQLLRRLRVERKLTQVRLADCAFVGRAHLAVLEAGRSTNPGSPTPTCPTRETVCSFAAALALNGVDTARLLISAGYWPWRMSDAAVTAFVEAVEEASAMGDDELAAFRRRSG